MSTVKAKSHTIPMNPARAEQKKQSWISNVSRCMGWTKEKAEDTYNRIFNRK